MLIRELVCGRLCRDTRQAYPHTSFALSKEMPARVRERAKQDHAAASVTSWLCALTHLASVVCSGMWRFRMWGFKILVSNPSPISASGAKSPSLQFSRVNKLLCSNPTSSNTTSLNSRQWACLATGWPGLWPLAAEPPAASCAQCPY